MVVYLGLDVVDDLSPVCLSLTGETGTSCRFEVLADIPCLVSTSIPFSFTREEKKIKRTFVTLIPSFTTDYTLHRISNVPVRVGEPPDHSLIETPRLHQSCAWRSQPSLNFKTASENTTQSQIFSYLSRAAATLWLVAWAGIRRAQLDHHWVADLGCFFRN